VVGVGVGAGVAAVAAVRGMNVEALAGAQRLAANRPAVMTPAARPVAAPALTRLIAIPNFPRSMSHHFARLPTIQVTTLGTFGRCGFAIFVHIGSAHGRMAGCRL